METAAARPQPSVDPEAIAGQKDHWGATFDANPDMYGTDREDWLPESPCGSHSHSSCSAA